MCFKVSYLKIICYFDITTKNPCPSTESGRHGHDSTIAGDPRIDPVVPLSTFAWVKEHVHSLPWWYDTDEIRLHTNK